MLNIFNDSAVKNKNLITSNDHVVQLQVKRTCKAFYYGRTPRHRDSEGHYVLQMFFMFLDVQAVFSCLYSIIITRSIKNVIGSSRMRIWADLELALKTQRESRVWSNHEPASTSAYVSSTHRIVHQTQCLLSTKTREEYTQWRTNSKCNRSERIEFKIAVLK